ncbi:hypothetical protein GPJ56_003400 [Histomonas meleagridis]|uniref:uncharacterized protein n=1 Tax=Histomonas meleagridis TaxID=135588 RepID=UPI00355986D3|nr:hypothetical protein GPJ56_003400 [Histomonas meleagridis]KAH0805019.1 hypothetical protein GO595_001964 [Histomonas meleagridis]
MADEKKQSIFWAKKVIPGENSHLDIPDDCYVSITNVCIPELPENGDDSPIRLFAHVKIIKPDKSNKDGFTATQSTCLIASLIPKKIEQQQINVLFSPLNIVDLEVQGSVPIHVSGIRQQINSLIEEEEEEEQFEEEEKNE